MARRPPKANTLTQTLSEKFTIWLWVANYTAKAFRVNAYSPLAGVCAMDGASKPTWKYLRRPAKGG